MLRDSAKLLNLKSHVWIKLKSCVQAGILASSCYSTYYIHWIAVIFTLKPERPEENMNNSIKWIDSIDKKNVMSCYMSCHVGRNKNAKNLLKAVTGLSLYWGNRPVFETFTSETLCYFSELFINAFGYLLPLVWCMKLSKTCTHNFNYLCFKHGCMTELVRKMMISYTWVSKTVIKLIIRLNAMTATHKSHCFSLLANNIELLRSRSTKQR